jgi:hypothetical protein
MRKLILLVGMMAAALAAAAPTGAQVLQSWEAPSGKIGFYPISNEISLLRNVDDAGEDRGTTLQVVAINSFRLLTQFNLEFTADYNWDYTEGRARDHYVELGLVKPVSSFVALSYQRVISSFEPESVNQFGLRLVF